MRRSSDLTPRKTSNVVFVSRLRSGLALRSSLALCSSLALRSSLASGSLLLLFVTACGGSTPSGQSANDGSNDGYRSEGDAGGPSGSSTPAGPNCDDGTCFLCGSGICPLGAYCDESAPGGAACAWLPECSKAPTCSCVLDVLGASCSCTEASGQPIVTCN